MPQYDFRCNACRLRFAVSYRSYADYDAATLICPECDSDDLARLITTVALSKPSRDYRKMSAGEMLSVLESGDRRQASELFRQVGGEPTADKAAPKRPDEPAGGGAATGSG